MVVESAFISATGEVRIRHRTGRGPCAPACEAVSPRGSDRARRSPLPCFDSCHCIGQSSEYLKITIRGGGNECSTKIAKSIATPEYPDPEEARRFICDEYDLYGYDYVFLEDAIWNALCHIAREEGCTVDELCSHIELNFVHGDAPFAPAARAYVLHTSGEHTADCGELPPRLRHYPSAFAAGRAQ
jgi:hypothetical protein